MKNQKYGKKLQTTTQKYPKSHRIVGLGIELAASKEHNEEWHLFTSEAEELTQGTILNKHQGFWLSWLIYNKKSVHGTNSSTYSMSLPQYLTIKKPRCRTIY